MVHMSIIEARMTQLGIRISRFFRPELQELQHILTDDEKIVALVPGRYFGGYALLISTDHRLLLIDKRTFYLTVEDIHYDMIAEIDFSVRLFDATLQIHTMNKQHRFTSSRYKSHLRRLTDYVQQQIIQNRNYQKRQRELQTMTPQERAEAFLKAAEPKPLKEVLPRPHIEAPKAAFQPALPPSHDEIQNRSRYYRTFKFKKVGEAALNGNHRLTSHIHVPHPHLPSTPKVSKADVFYPSQAVDSDAA